MITVDRTLSKWLVGNNLTSECLPQVDHNGQNLMFACIVPTWVKVAFMTGRDPMTLSEEDKKVLVVEWELKGANDSPYTIRMAGELCSTT